MAPPFTSVAEEDVGRVGFQPQIWVGALHLPVTLCGTCGGWFDFSEPQFLLHGAVLRA